MSIELDGKSHESKQFSNLNLFSSPEFLKFD